MFDDVVKALTIKISADDLTGGAWSGIGKAAKGLMDMATPLNQAWELTGKVIEGVAGSMEKPIQWLSEGGEFAEAEAGLIALANSHKVNVDKILASIRDYSDGSLDLVKATKASSDAIRMGFSDEQVGVIWKFANKYADTMGGEVLQIATQIENAIFTGKGKSAKEYGLNIAIGASFDDIKKQMELLSKSMGDGAFNFGEELEKMATSAGDAGLKIKEYLNNLVGEGGFGDITTWFIDGLRSVETMAPEIATAMFKPIMDAIDIGGEMIRGFFSFFGDLTGMAFESSDSLGTRLTTIVSTIGNTAYDTIEFVIDGINLVLTPINSLAMGIFGINEAVLRMRLSAAEYMGSSSETINDLKLMISESQELSKIGFFAIDKSDIEKRQEAYNKSIIQSGHEAKKTAEAHKEMSHGIQKAGEAFEDAMKKEENAKSKTHEATRALVKSNNDLSKSYQDVEKAAYGAYGEAGKGLADTIKSIGEIEAETTKGINATIGQLAEMAKMGNLNTLEGHKIQDLLHQQQLEKAREQSLLERQAEAQNRLAGALSEYSRTPKRVEFYAPNNPNTAEMLLQFIVNWLVEQARAEGTVIQA